MKIGTKSVLFGAHQFLLHPLFVAAAWWKLYGFPWDPRLWVAFFVHDLGYWEKPNMDGPEGESHPLLGAAIMGWLFDRPTGETDCPDPECNRGLIGWEDEDGEPVWMVCRLCEKAAEKAYQWYDFTLFHSRFVAKRQGSPFSRLCVADKLATCLMPTWFYLFVTNLSGEVLEYMDVAHHREGGKYAHEIRVLGSQREWVESMKAYMLAWIAEHRDGRADTWTKAKKESEAA